MTTTEVTAMVKERLNGCYDWRKPMFSGTMPEITVPTGEILDDGKREVKDGRLYVYVYDAELDETL